jgi:hypothetical protein
MPGSVMFWLRVASCGEGQRLFREQALLIGCPATPSQSRDGECAILPDAPKFGHGELGPFSKCRNSLRAAESIKAYVLPPRLLFPKIPSLTHRYTHNGIKNCSPRSAPIPPPIGSCCSTAHIRLGGKHHGESYRCSCSQGRCLPAAGPWHQDH